MVFYFSATGNTKWIAQTIAEALGDQAIDITGADPKAFSFGKDDWLGVCFPVYATAAPDNVKAFCQELSPNGARTFAVCNYSNFAAYALQNFSETVLPLSCGYGLLMPDNTSVLGYTYDDEASTKRKLAEAPALLDAIIQRIKAKEDGVFDAYVGEVDDPAGMSATFPAVFNSQYALTEPYYVEKDKCVSCGLCEANCPSHALELQDGYPLWVKDHCLLCSACINNCPVEAIEYGDKSQGVYRYTFAKYAKQSKE